MTRYEMFTLLYFGLVQVEPKILIPMDPVHALQRQAPNVMDARPYLPRGRHSVLGVNFSILLL